MLLTLTDLSLTYEGDAGQSPVSAFEHIDLRIEQGEFVAIIGPSGCGKTSLLEAVGGLRKTTSGRAEIDGEPIEGPHPDVGVVFQEESAFPWLTTYQNIEFGLKHRGVPKADRSARASAMVRLVGLEGFERHRPAQLSGGMRQRVALARALAPLPHLLLMDEPFGALDEQSRLVLGDELLRIWKETGCTILFITHSLSEAAMLADRVVVMSARPGRVQAVLQNPVAEGRSSAMLGTPGFTELTRVLWNHLRSEVEAVAS